MGNMEKAEGARKPYETYRISKAGEGMMQKHQWSELSYSMTVFEVQSVES